MECIYVSHLPLFRLKMIKNYRTIPLQEVKKSPDHFEHEMTTYYSLLDGRNKATSTDITIADPTESEEHNNMIQ